MQSPSVENIGSALANAGLCPVRLDELELAAMRNALARFRGSRRLAAASLGISIRTLQRKMKDYALLIEALDGVEPESFKGLSLPDGLDWKSGALALHGRTAAHGDLLRAAQNCGLDVEADGEDRELSFIARPGAGPFGRRVIGEIRAGAHAVLTLTAKIDSTSSMVART